MRPEIDVAAGTLDDVPAAQRLIEGARQWLRARSVDQWQDPIADATIVRDIKQGHFFVVRIQGEVVAMVSVSDDDTDVWGSATENAFYVHRLAVAQSHRGQDLGSALLEWVAKRASDSGAAFLRLDCAAENQGLRRFYEKRGFVHLRNATVPAPTGTRSFAVSLYEMPVR